MPTGRKKEKPKKPIIKVVEIFVTGCKDCPHNSEWRDMGASGYYCGHPDAATDSWYSFSTKEEKGFHKDCPL